MNQSLPQDKFTINAKYTQNMYVVAHSILFISIWVGVDQTKVNHLYRLWLMEVKTTKVKRNFFLNEIFVQHKLKAAFQVKPTKCLIILSSRK